MKSNFNSRSMMSFILILSTTLLMGQTQEKKSIADVVYQDYKEKGIDKALQRYTTLKEKEASTYNIDEFELNRIGYKIMNEDKDLEAAEKVFRMNMEEYPEAANPQDSYADYLITAGNEEEAKKYLRESIARTQKGKGDLDDTRLYYASLGKLARLEKKHTQLDFLIGDWDMEVNNISGGKVVSQMKEINNIYYDEENGVVIADFLRSDGTPLAKRVFAYDAVDDEFDVVYIGANEMLGLWPSTLKVEKKGDNTYQAVEKYLDENNKNVTLRHEISILDNNSLKWNIFHETRGEEVAVMNFRKR